MTLTGAENGLRHAVETLSSQRDVVDAMGGELPAAGDGVRLSELASNLQTSASSSSSSVVEALTLSLGEIANRQRLISDLLGISNAEDSIEAIALDALAGAMHRVRTCLDVAMGSVEEIAELSADMADAEGVSVSAGEAIRSLRLVYHYTHELNEMAAVKERLQRIEATPFGCLAVVNEAVARFTPVAADCGVIVRVADEDGEIDCDTDAGVVRRILRQLLLLAIVSPGVSEVTIATKVLRHPGGGLVTLRVTDNGSGLSLLDRAAAHRLDASCGDDRRAADLAGFAVARRMAKAVGGKITLEYLKGRGSRAQFSFPANLPGSRE